MVALQALELRSSVQNPGKHVTSTSAISIQTYMDTHANMAYTVVFIYIRMYINTHIQIQHIQMSRN